MYFVFNGNEEDLKIGIDHSVSSNITNHLPSSNLDIKNINTKDIKSKIEDDNLDGFIYQKVIHFM